jgi:Leucine-rich repeat (LRR) protein
VVARYPILPKSQKDTALPKHPNTLRVHTSHQFLIQSELEHRTSITYPSNTQIRWLAGSLYACTHHSLLREVQIIDKHKKQDAASQCATRRKDPGVLRLRSEQE